MDPSSIADQWMSIAGAIFIGFFGWAFRASINYVLQVIRRLLKLAADEVCQDGFVCCECGVRDQEICQLQCE